MIEETITFTETEFNTFTRQRTLMVLNDVIEYLSDYDKHLQKLGHTARNQTALRLINRAFLEIEQCPILSTSLSTGDNEKLTN